MSRIHLINLSRRAADLSSHFPAWMKVIVAILIISVPVAYGSSGDQSYSPEVAEVIYATGENENLGYYDGTLSFTPLGGVGGRMSGGNLCLVRPGAQVNTGLWIEIELVNRKEMNYHYTSFVEKFAIYQTATENAELWDREGSWQKLGYGEGYLTQIGPPLTIEVHADNVSHRRPLSIALVTGSFYPKEGLENYPGPSLYVEVATLE